MNDFDSSKRASSQSLVSGGGMNPSLSSEASRELVMDIDQGSERIANAAGSTSGAKVRPKQEEVERFRRLVAREDGDSAVDAAAVSPVESRGESAPADSLQGIGPGGVCREDAAAATVQARGSDVFGGSSVSRKGVEGDGREGGGVSGMFRQAMSALPKSGRRDDRREGGSVSSQRSASAHAGASRSAARGDAVSSTVVGRGTRGNADADGRALGDKGVAAAEQVAASAAQAAQAALMGQSSQGVQGVADVHGTPAGMEAAARCEELVERILVSRPAADGSEEVRIKLDSSWLPETEVRMVKAPGMGLSIEFVSDEVGAQRFLLPNLANLRERLAERTGDQVAVRMSEHAGDGDEREGRGRNRRNLYEELGDGR